MNRFFPPIGSDDLCLLFCLHPSSTDRLNEILYPHYNETRVREIINKYETEPALIHKKAIGKEGFTRSHFNKKKKKTLKQVVGKKL